MREIEAKRSDNYAVDEQFEAMLSKVNASISHLELEEIKNVGESECPLLFFCMPPRTGSTLISQMLALTGEFSYPSNFTARFWEAPFIAMQLEKRLGIRNDRLEKELDSQDFKSDFGVTQRLSEPHEFGFFWRKHLPITDTHFVSEAEFANDGILGKEINAMMSVFNKPFFMKSANVSVNAHILGQIFPRAKFLLIKRSIVYTAQSLYLSRIKRYGNPLAWWSIKPRNYNEIISLFPDDPFSQIAMQLNGIYSDISFTTNDIRDRCLTIEYENFCQNPIESICEIFDILEANPPNAEWQKNLPSRIDIHNQIKVESDVFEQIEKALRHHKLI